MGERVDATPQPDRDPAPIDPIGNFGGALASHRKRMDIFWWLPLDFAGQSPAAALPGSPH